MIGCALSRTSYRNHNRLRGCPGASAHICGKELYQEEFRDNLCLRYGLMPQDIPATCDSCGKKLSIKHALSSPKGGLVLAWHDDDAKEWGSLGARDLVQSGMTYK